MLAAMPTDPDHPSRPRPRPSVRGAANAVGAGVHEGSRRPAEGAPDGRAIAHAARGRCPACGAGALFDGFLTPVETCEGCGLDLSRFEAGDGPVVFVILIVGFVVLGLALWAEVVHGLPLAWHFVLWPPLALVLSLALTRILKGALIGQQYRTGAAEGRWGSPADVAGPGRTGAHEAGDVSTEDVSPPNVSTGGDRI